MKQLLSNKTFTMQQDGWSSVQNDPVIATSVVSDGKGYFVDAKTKEPPTRLCLGTRSLMLRQPMGIRYGLSDNAKNMDNPIPYGCLSHVLNLLGQDLTPAPIMKHIVEINKFFRNHHVPISLAEGSTGIHSSSATK